MSAVLADAGSTLFWLTGPTLGSTRLRAGIDAVLGFAVFARNPQVLFSHDAVSALCYRIGDTDQRLADLRRLIDSFPLYDVDTIWVDGASLAERAIGADRLPAFAHIVTTQRRNALLRDAGAVFAY